MKALRIFLRAYWPLMVIPIAVILSLTIIIQIFKEPPYPSNLPLIERIAKHVFDWVIDWSIPLSALITLVLAFAAFFSISDNRHFQDKREKLENKRHALQEIHDWAEQVLDSFYPIDWSEIRVGIQADKTEIQRLIHRRGMSAIAASKVVSQELEQKVSSVHKDIEELENSLVTDKHAESFDFENKLTDIRKALTDLINQTFVMW